MASLLSYGACQTVCNTGVVACYAAAGLTFGTVTGGMGAPAAALACNSAQGACMAACASKFLIEGAAETAASGGILAPLIGVGGTAIAVGTGAAAFAGAVGTGAAATAGTEAAAASTAATVAGFSAARIALMAAGSIGIGLTVAYAAYKVWDWSASCGAKSSRTYALFPDQRVCIIKCRAGGNVVKDSYGQVGRIRSYCTLPAWAREVDPTVLRVKENCELDVSHLPGGMLCGVLRAWYGAPGHEWTTAKGSIVTDKVMEILRQRRPLLANNENFGDPAPWTLKVLLLEVPVGTGSWSIEVDSTGELLDAHATCLLPIPERVCLVNLQASAQLHGQIGKLQAYQEVGTAFLKSDTANHRRSSITVGGELLRSVMTVEEAKLRAPEFPGCKGFWFRGEETEAPIEIVFHDGRLCTELSHCTSYRAVQATAIVYVRQHGMLDVRDVRSGVLRAWYGVPGHEWTAMKGKMVTDVVKTMLSQGQAVQASNRNFGDPAPWIAKVLVLEVHQGSWSIRMEHTNEILHVPEASWAAVPDEVAFPIGIRVAESAQDGIKFEQRVGTVVSIEGGLVGVDFADGRERVLIEVSQLRVLSTR
eukprot:gnl/TRDRNA2_/TRDRNA2_192871_c0_seq1.p1 gnl/TRDRNA2_/TRDRNA2_192871_c0~~gnl/TRDRNA2_/TRDRNA2_192871_c0_seq1.p1  ORF type:complete len:591 (+),score=74.97 gnl/TRDRNA2_/TRDRNA2_192871_c0_seq1:119-1891(+)